MTDAGHVTGGHVTLRSGQIAGQAVTVALALWTGLRYVSFFPYPTLPYLGCSLFEMAERVSFGKEKLQRVWEITLDR